MLAEKFLQIVKGVEVMIRGRNILDFIKLAGVNKKQENSFSFPRQKFRSPCISRSNFAPTPLIYQFFLVFKQQLFEVTKKNKKMCQK